MRKTYFLFILFIISMIAFADEGDTIVVQTIDFETPVNPGWNAPREEFSISFYGKRMKLINLNR